MTILNFDKVAVLHQFFSSYNIFKFLKSALGSSRIMGNYGVPPEGDLK